MAAQKSFRCGSPLSSTAKTEVRPTESCLRDCRGGDGMWYQHSPVGRGGGGKLRPRKSQRTKTKCGVLTCRVLLGHGPSVEHCSVPGDGPHLVGSADGDGLEGLVGAHVQPGAALERHNTVGKGGFWEGARVAPKLSAAPHRGVLGTGSQATQHIPLLADGPDGDLLHLALGQAGHQGDVTQTEGRYLPPRASHGDLALPVGGNTPCVDIDPGTEPRGCVCPVTSSSFCVSQSPSWFCVRGKFCWTK